MDTCFKMPAAQALQAAKSQQKADKAAAAKAAAKASAEASASASASLKALWDEEAEDENAPLVGGAPPAKRRKADMVLYCGACGASSNESKLNPTQSFNWISPYLPRDRSQVQKGIGYRDGPWLLSTGMSGTVMEEGCWLVG